MTQKWSDLNEKFNSYIETVAEDNELKNHRLDQTPKQKLKKEVNVSFRNKWNKFSTNSTLNNWQNWKKQNIYLRLTKKIDEVISEMRKHKKLIRLADRSAGGWMTLQEYMPNKLASNSDDSRKMRQAENRATKKRKLAFPRKPSSTFSSATQFHQSNLGNPTPPYTGSQF